MISMGLYKNETSNTYTIKCLATQTVSDTAVYNNVTLLNYVFSIVWWSYTSTELTTCQE